MQPVAMNHDIGAVLNDEKDINIEMKVNNINNNSLG